MISFADRDGYIWKDGIWHNWREANLHVLSHGLHYGSCVFEGERAYNGKIYKLQEHSERLIASARYLDMEIDYSVEELNDISQEVLSRNDILDGYIRPFAWRGSEMMAVSARDTTIHVAVAAWPWPRYFSKELVEQGIKTDFATWRRPAPETVPWQSKAAGLYMICTLSKHIAEQNGYNDAVMLDHRGFLAETTGANLFLVFDGELHTPIADCFLNGITRRTIISLAEGMGIKVVERYIKPEELKNASEVFICGTAAEVMPVRQVGEHNFNRGRVSSVIMDAYKEETRK